MFFFQKFLSLRFFGQIWSQNLKFSKLTEIWYRRTLLYAYYDFDVYFSYFFVSHIFWGRQIWSHNLKFMTEILQRGTLLHAYYDLNVYFFQKFCQSYFLGKIWSQNLKFSKLTEIWYSGTLLYVITTLMFIFYKVLSFR